MDMFNEKNTDMPLSDVSVATRNDLQRRWKRRKRDICCNIFDKHWQRHLSSPVTEIFYFRGVYVMSRAQNCMKIWNSVHSKQIPVHELQYAKNAHENCSKDIDTKSSSFGRSGRNLQEESSLQETDFLWED